MRSSRDRAGRILAANPAAAELTGYSGEALLELDIAQLADETLVKAIVAMGHSLGLKIVAEGVETSGQYEFLRSQGCDLVQGNLFAPPMDPAPLEELLAAHREISARRKEGVSPC